MTAISTFDPVPLEIDECVIAALAPSETADRQPPMRRLLLCHRVIDAWYGTMPRPPAATSPTFVTIMIGDEPRGHIELVFRPGDRRRA